MLNIVQDTALGWSLLFQNLTKTGLLLYLYSTETCDSRKINMSWPVPLASMLIISLFP